MKKFFTVLSFEIGNYLKNRAYMVSTILIAALLAFGMFLPSIVDMSELLGTKTTQEQKEDREEETKENMVYYDKAGVGITKEILEASFENTTFTQKDKEEEVKKAVENEEAKAGFVITSSTEFDYYVVNNGMYDSQEQIFQQIMSSLYRQNYCKSQNIDYQQLESVYQTTIVSNQHILGKDIGANFWYCYILVIVIFMMIILYGVMIATSVTSEKSNRSIEVLITSAPSNCLLFGKVLAGAIAGLFQAVVIMVSVLIPYKINQDAWGGALDLFLDIPTEVLITFLLFGLGGFLFYAFIYGAMGAMVSKTEDINRTAGSLQMIIMIVYFVVMIQLQANPEGIIMNVASFLPISSYSAMFIRVAMGTAELWEIVVSFVILVVSTIGTGFLGAKIYRMGTLRYGNPIKFSQLIKMSRKSKKEAQ